MKRTDAISIIHKHLAPLGINESTCNEVLSLLEDAGLRPPDIGSWYADYPDHRWDEEKETEELWWKSYSETQQLEQAIKKGIEEARKKEQEAILLDFIYEETE